MGATTAVQFLLVIVTAGAAYQLPTTTNVARTRVAAPSMKGRPSRGMPGKGATGPGTGGGFRKGYKSQEQKKDFSKSEWTLVAEKGELGSELGATAAAEAGMSPMGQNYIWTLIRGDDGDEEGSTLWATDGSCPACSFPMVKGTTAKEADKTYSHTCSSCGSKFSLETGAALEWLPGNGPIQWAAQQLNKNKEVGKANLLMTRVSKAGRCYLRLPDGTLKAEKTAAQRAAELSGAA